MAQIPCISLPDIKNINYKKFLTVLHVYNK